MPEYGEEPAPDENGNKILKDCKDCKGLRWSNEVREETSNNSSLMHTKKVIKIKKPA